MRMRVYPLIHPLFLCIIDLRYLLWVGSNGFLPHLVELEYYLYFCAKLI